MDVVEVPSSGPRSAKPAGSPRSGWRRPAIAGAVAFWSANLVISVTPIAAAYRWPMNKIVEALTHAGFEVIGQRSNPRTPHAYITARATPGFS